MPGASSGAAVETLPPTFPGTLLETEGKGIMSKFETSRRSWLIASVGTMACALVALPFAVASQSGGPALKMVRAAASDHEGGEHEGGAHEGGDHDGSGHDSSGHDSSGHDGGDYDGDEDG